jgi:[ribosomal protein S5]-alanine N-acetyltransferase
MVLIPPWPNTRVQRTRSSPSAPHSPLTRYPLGRKSMPPALSSFKESHAEDFAKAARRSKALHRAWVHPPTEASTAAELASRRQGPSDFGFLVRMCDTGEITGYIEVTNIIRGPFQSAYLGFYMFKGFERQGYMKWALRTIVQRAWKTLQLHRLEANIQPANAASIALVKSLGFQKEGYSPRYLKIGGRWRDHERWAIRAR